MMNLEALLCCLTCLFGVGLCLWGDARERLRLLGLGKMIASASFLTLALCATEGGALGDRYLLGVRLALSASLLGDACLIWRTELAFLAGLGAFLIAHLLFAWAALSALPTLSLTGWVAGAVALTLGGLVLRWLKPSVPQDLWWPSVAYMCVISGMVGVCLQLSIERGDAIVGLAAVGFWLSDLSVARDRFQSLGLSNRLWGIPLYFASQLLFGLSLYPH